MKKNTISTSSKSNTDWAKLKALPDHEIDYSDIPEIDPDFFKLAKVVMPNKKTQLTIRFDEDMVEWFKAQGKGYQTHMNQVLRTYFQSKDDQ